MNERLNTLAASIRDAFGRAVPSLRSAASQTGRTLINSRTVIIATMIAAIGAYALVTHPPISVGA